MSKSKAGAVRSSHSNKTRDYSPPSQHSTKTQPKMYQPKTRAALSTSLPTESVAKQDTSKCGKCFQKGHGDKDCTFVDNQQVSLHDISNPIMYYPSRKEVAESNVAYCNRCLQYGHRIAECQKLYNHDTSSTTYSGIPYCDVCSKSGHKTQDCFALRVQDTPQIRKNILHPRFQRPIIAKYKVRQFNKIGYLHVDSEARIHTQPSRLSKTISTVKGGSIINAHDTSSRGIEEQWLTTYIETGEVGYVCIFDSREEYLELVC